MIVGKVVRQDLARALQDGRLGRLRIELDEIYVPDRVSAQKRGDVTRGTRVAVEVVVIPMKGLDRLVRLGSPSMREWKNCALPLRSRQSPARTLRLPPR